MHDGLMHSSLEAALAVLERGRSVVKKVQGAMEEVADVTAELKAAEQVGATTVCTHSFWATPCPRMPARTMIGACTHRSPLFPACRLEISTRSPASCVRGWRES